MLDVKQQTAITVDVAKAPPPKYCMEDIQLLREGVVWRSQWKEVKGLVTPVGGEKCEKFYNYAMPTTLNF